MQQNPDLSQLGEFGFIELLRQRFATPQGVTGIGDDCAILPQHSGTDTLVSTDLLVEDVHFLRHEITPYDLGWRSAAVNISDIAAMGGKPTATFLSIALPADVPQQWLRQFVEGYHAISERFGVALLGGDTTSSRGAICINVGVLGTAPHATALRRSAARPGDLVCVTNTLGDSAAGLDVLLSHRSRSEAFVAPLLGRHFTPTPRVAEGLLLAQTPGVHAAMDISDGIASDLPHILEASGVGAVVDTAAVPLSPQLQSYCSHYGLDPLHFALEGGEDYELLFTMSPDTRPGLAYSVIGRITADAGLRWEGAAQHYSGFHHF